jgi:hypothetical protein
MKNISTFLRNCLYIYISIVAFWIFLAVVFLSIYGLQKPDSAIGYIGVAQLFFLAIVPLVTLVNVILVYTLSMLDGFALKKNFIITSTILGEISTIFAWLNFREDFEYVFLIHVATIVLVFTAWKLLRGWNR